MTQEIANLKILTVDDDDVDREKIRRMLKKTVTDSEIYESSSLEQSMKMLSSTTYDCVIADYRLGPEDGLNLLRHIRRTLKSQCAVIIVTGLGDEETAAEALRLGANDYLVKNNLHPQKLLKALHSAIQQAELEKKVLELAHYDRLTGLVSRHLLIDRIQQVIAQVSRTGKVGALAFIDLDDFKPVNDQYGHEAGDQVLRTVAERLKSSLRTTDTAARLGGDEFVLLLPEVTEPSKCEDLLKRILLMLGVPILLANGRSVRISASIGVSLLSDSGLSPDTILHQADQAMYQAKNKGKNKVLFFEAKEEERQSQRRDLLARVQKGIEQNEFTLFYQPKVDIALGQCLGVEALIRWNHPDRGLLEPGEFKDALVHTAIGVTLGEWVIEEAIKQHKRWITEGLNVKISVNIAPVHIHSCEFIPRLDYLLNKYEYSADAGFLEFEVLESASIKDVDQSLDVLEQCKERGIQIALDDFGTGHASLKYLKLLPLNTLKIDQSFIKNIESQESDIAIVKSIISLSKAFGYQLIAEGVQTDSQASKLIELGCYGIQGFLFSLPVGGSQITQWLLKNPASKDYGYCLRL